MAALSENHCTKAADVFAAALARYGVEESQVDIFRRAVAKELGRLETRPFFFGNWDGPNSLIRAALRKAKVTPSVFTDVIIVAFERGDKVIAYENGKWYKYEPENANADSTA